MMFETGASGRVLGEGGVRLGFEWWPGPGPVVCMHGLTSHRRAFAALAEEVAPAHGMLSFDLRGRGESDKPTGPYGMDQHARDIAAALDAIGITEPVVLAGHSMGAYVLTAFAARFPERVRAAILLDGGYFLKPPGSVEASELEGMLGLFVERLTRTWTNVDELADAFEATPLYAGLIDDAARRYFAFDVAGEHGSLHAKASLDAVRYDWGEIVRGTDTVTNLATLRCPTLLVRAHGGLTGVGDLVIPDDVLAQIKECVPHVEVVDLLDDNHHSMLTTRAGAERTARALRPFLTRNR